MSSTEAAAATQTETKVADKAGTAIDAKRQRSNNRKKRQNSRNSSRKPRGGDNKEPRQDEKKRQNSASRRNQRVRKTAGESSPRDKAPNKSNILTIGRRLQMTRYVAIVKNVFAQDLDPNPIGCTVAILTLGRFFFGDHVDRSSISNFRICQPAIWPIREGVK